MKKKILIVEDEKDLVTTLTFRLAAENYDVIAAYEARFWDHADGAHFAQCARR